MTLKFSVIRVRKLSELSFRSVFPWPKWNLIHTVSKPQSLNSSGFIWHFASLLAEVSHYEAKMRERRQTSAGFRSVVWWSHQPDFWSKLTIFKIGFVWYVMMTIIEPIMEGVDVRPTMTHNLVIVRYVTLLLCSNGDISQRFCSFVWNDGRLVVYFSQ